jgi:restriction system-associated AAA family ATPase
MKLLKLEINSDYGSLKKGFKLSFRDELSRFFEPKALSKEWNDFHPFCFAGLNGSGKSNVLEALANIFYHIECCANVNQPQVFLDSFDEKDCKPNAFLLQYYILKEKGAKSTIENFTLVTIQKKVGKLPEMHHQPYPFNGEKVKVSVVAQKNGKIQAEAKKYLPDLVIGYSSGENEILSIPFLKTRLVHFDEYLEALNENLKYNEPESSLIYIDYEMSQAVLLSNYMFQEDSVLEPLETELGIKSIKRFRMNVNKHSEGKNNIIDRYSETLAKFKKCSTSYYENDTNLTIDFWVNLETKKAFEINFKDGIFELFRAFQILYTLNYRTVDGVIKSDVYQSKGYYTDGKVPRPAPEETVFHFLDYYIEKENIVTKEISHLLMKNLSDGEQQFLHTLGICLMLKNKSAILLLDEPETHFNPDWRSKFIRTLQKSLEASKTKNIMKDVLITSHSPFIISDCFPDKVIVFKKGEDPKNAQKMKFRTYGTSTDLIMENLFKKNYTIGDKSREEIEKILKEIENKETLLPKEVSKYKKRVSHLGDSMEKILLFAKLNELELE